MELHDVLNLIGGLCLFLFGMHIMSEALERKAGGSLRGILGKLTSNKWMGFLTGIGVTAIIQSSSATTVMVVGFVNSGLITLRQSIMVIMGANIGTTVTAWMLSLVGIEGGNLFLELLKPTVFSPILALVGVVLYIFLKNEKNKDTGLILLGFSTLMIGMETMSAAVSGLQSMPAFGALFLMFSNPLLGLLVGMVLTAVIQSSSASVGILQALAATGQVTYGAAIPLIIGQNIGTCATTLISCVGTTKNAKRTALVHLFFNVIGALFWIMVYWIISVLFRPVLLSQATTAVGVAVIHSLFNGLCTLLMLPLAGWLEFLVVRLVPDGKDKERPTELDERLFVAPSVALQRSCDVTADMGISTALRVRDAMKAISGSADSRISALNDRAENIDLHKTELDAYLVKLSALHLDTESIKEVAMLLKVSGELHYIARQGTDIARCAKQLHDGNLVLSAAAQEEFHIMESAVRELLRLSLSAFTGSDPMAASVIPALARVVHECKEQMYVRHVYRLQQHSCAIESSAVWLDLLTALERVTDHCTKIAEHILAGRPQLDSGDPTAQQRAYMEYKAKYMLAADQK